ncbi:MAG TPA: hypothetical protein VES60_10555, partial [Nakamurella sp.]|nr:hypothetical protein [Nakamurella sp.]
IAVLGTVFAARAKEQLGMFSSPDLAASVLSTGQSPRLVAAVPAELRLSAEQAIEAAFADGP